MVARAIRYSFLAFLLAVLPGVTVAQALRDINFAYLYDPVQTFQFGMYPARTTEGWSIAWRLAIDDTTLATTDDFLVQWEGRTSLSDAEPGHLPEISLRELTSGAEGISGIVSFHTGPAIVVARVVKRSAKQAWLFYSHLMAEWPVDSYAISNGTPLTSGYLHPDDTLIIGGGHRMTGSYYSTDFPAGLPAFSERLGPVPPAIQPDSIFTYLADEPIKLPKEGLYLFQRDTLSSIGLAFRVQRDYPKLGRLSSLAGPLIYITTRQEYNRLSEAGEDKRAFDRVILGITDDVDRARTLMRNYFKRVEFANRHFTSYKEGWKTDRGMIYIIFGPPATVHRFVDREIWTYDNAFNTETFNFARSSTLFDPDNFVLIRREKYRELWYQMVDLWRAARF